MAENFKAHNITINENTLLIDEFELRGIKEANINLLHNGENTITVTFVVGKVNKVEKNEDEQWKTLKDKMEKMAKIHNEKFIIPHVPDIRLGNGYIVPIKTIEINKYVKGDVPPVPPIHKGGIVEENVVTVGDNGKETIIPLNEPSNDFIERMANAVADAVMMAYTHSQISARSVYIDGESLKEIITNNT